jgi:hypothetical protein
MSEPALDPSTKQRADSQREQHHREQEREHGTESTEQHAEVTQPQHLHPESCEAGERQRQRRPTHVCGREGGTVGRFQSTGVDDGLRRRTTDEKRSRGGHEVQRDGHHLRREESERGNQREVRDERAGGRAQCVDAVERGDAPSTGREIAANAGAHEHGQRSAHQHGDRSKEQQRQPRAPRV